MEIEIDDFTLNQHIEHYIELGHDFRIPGEEYRTLDYVKAQCAKLAAQLASE